MHIGIKTLLQQEDCLSAVRASKDRNVELQTDTNIRVIATTLLEDPKSCWINHWNRSNDLEGHSGGAVTSGCDLCPLPMFECPAFWPRQVPQVCNVSHARL